MPSERIAKYAARQWKEMMTKGKAFDQLGSTRGQNREELHNEAVDDVMVKMINHEEVTEEKLDLLVEFLATAIMKNEALHYMHVDYGPSPDMQEVAVAAGLAAMQWPIKSSVSVMDDSVAVRNGYGAEPVYHYPLKDGKWLSCSLSGTDMTIILDKIEEGENPLGLTVIED